MCGIASRPSGSSINARTCSTTRSIDTPVVSMTTASGATAERRHRARGVALVAFGERGGDFGELGALRARVRRIRGAAAGPLLRRRIQVDLHVGVGEDDRPDVAPFHHHAAALAGRALARDEHAAHGRVPRHRGGGLVDLRGADRASSRRGRRCRSGRLRRRTSARSPSAAVAASSARSTPSCSAFHASARYIAPVSMWR